LNLIGEYQRLFSSKKHINAQACPTQADSYLVEKAFYTKLKFAHFVPIYSLMDKSHSILFERPIMVSSIQSVANTPPQVASRPASAMLHPAPSAGAADIAHAKSQVPVEMERMKQNLEVTIGRLNEQMRDGGRNVTFAMDETLGRPIVVVRKEDTGEVIRQIPNEVVVKVAHNIEALKGLLMNKKI
jgi:flagellar protein FlaG